ncbi:MAG: aminopeptidase N [Hyphomicrobiaceae bacterium]|nr:aminopeptidase N [Hyphomicrobiaceae bacterium]MCC0025283.1 aminopeptidase N [Hyphomicrobiaceae bacterium]
MSQTSPAPDADADKFVHLADYQPTPFEIRHVDLRFDIAEGETRVVSTLSIARREDAPQRLLELNGEELALERIEINGTPLPDAGYGYENDHLVIYDVPAAPFELTTEVIIRPEENTCYEGLFRSNGIWCTQCEAEGFRRITFMYDRPDVLSTYSVRIEADKAVAPVLLSNGNPGASGELGGGRHFAQWHDPFPKPTYLFALVAGDLAHVADTFTTASGKQVALKIHCEQGKQDRCGYAMQVLKDSMRWDESRWGREYDLDVFNIVAVSDFNSGAMENKGLNIFNDKLILASPETATDADYANVERVVSHEYFHNWTGNRITCRDWFQLCLKEGLTVFRDQEFTSDTRSRAVKRIDDIKDLWARQFPEDAGPLAHPPRPDHYEAIDNFYTSTVYEKGAEVVRMLLTILGREEFRKGMDLYFERHDGEATTIEAWIKVFEDASGEDLQQFLAWYTQAGTPEVRVATSWDEDARAFTLDLEQHVAPTPGEPDKKALDIPLSFGLVGPNGEDLEIGEVEGGDVSSGLIRLTGKKQTLTFKGLSAKPVLSINREFSAPVNVTDDLSPKELSFLARHDDDPVNRWMALQELAKEMMVGRVRSGSAYHEEELRTLTDAMKQTLERPNGDPSFKALCLSLPSEGELYSALKSDIDPDAVRAARDELMKLTGEALASGLADHYRASAPAGAFSLDFAEVDRRALRNQALRLLVATGDTEWAGAAARQFEQADNLTDRFAALSTSVHNRTPHADRLLREFGDASIGEPLVWDKWLILTATRPDALALDGVITTLGDSRFPKSNPNRFRALVGAFAINNVPQFARPDGKGFAFVAGTLGELDRANPQLAARLLTSFRTFRMFESNRRARAESALKKLAEQKHLSRNTEEILTLILEG